MLPSVKTFVDDLHKSRTVEEEERKHGKMHLMVPSVEKGYLREEISHRAWQG